jgi:hypothetical protein
MRQIIAFFIPLGLASCIVTISHVIINSTLSKAAHPEIVIASYAIGMSLLPLFDRPASYLRQVSATFSRDQHSFQSVANVTWLVIAGIIVVGGLISYTPLGTLLFIEIFRADREWVSEVIMSFRILMWVSVFSAIRMLYHGVMIARMRTHWITIAIAIRLLGMVALAQWFIRTDSINGGYVGAIIFTSGMAIEALVSFLEGRSIIRKMPKERETERITTPKVFSFYKPLFFSSFIMVAVLPAANAALGFTLDIKVAIASFAIAQSLFHLIMSLFIFTHLVVLNFYEQSPELVRRFQHSIAYVPGILLSILSFTPAGMWLLEHVIGLSGPLLDATHQTLAAHIVLALLLPWVDYGNGFLILRRTTHVFMWSQAANAIVALAALFILVMMAPQWNGIIGPVALTFGCIAECAVVATALYRQRQQYALRGITSGSIVKF